MPLSYANGHLFCAKCGEWVKKQNIEKESYINKNGLLLHECGYELRKQPRVSYSTIRRVAIKHTSPIKFSSSSTIRQDILKNKEKWEKILVQKNRV